MTMVTRAEIDAATGYELDRMVASLVFGDTVTVHGFTTYGNDLADLIEELVDRRLELQVFSPCRSFDRWKAVLTTPSDASVEAIGDSMAEAVCRVACRMCREPVQ